jgi:hypothetical protein
LQRVLNSAKLCFHGENAISVVDYVRDILQLAS